MDGKFYRALPLIPLNPGYDPIAVKPQKAPKPTVLRDFFGSLFESHHLQWPFWV